MGTLFQELLCVIPELIDQRTQRPNKVNTETITSYYTALHNADTFIYMPGQVPQGRGTVNKNNA